MRAISPDRAAELRARADALAQLAASLPRTDNKYTRGPRELVGYYGVVPDEVRAEYNRLYHLFLPRASRAPLTFAELTSRSTFFEAFPEKVAGTEVVLESSIFPVVIEGTSADAERVIRAGIAAATAPRPTTLPKPSSSLPLMRLKAKAAKAKLLLEQEAGGLAGVGRRAITTRFRYANLGGLGLLGLPGLSGLGDLVGATSMAVAGNADVVAAVLDKADKASKKSHKPGILKFDDVIRLYNPGISEDEIRAWVYYKRSLGQPMKGWDRYYLKGGIEADAAELAYASGPAPLYSSAFVLLETAATGTFLGKPAATSENVERGEVTYRVITSPAGTKVLVPAEHVRVKRDGASTNPRELERLVRAGALFVGLDGELIPFPAFVFGNMYDRELEVRKMEAHIVEKYGQDVYDRHMSVLKEARPRVLSILDPNPRERPVITITADFARNPRLFALKEVRTDYADVESAKAFKKVNGKVEYRKGKEAMNLNFDGENAYSLVQVFSAWLFTLTAQDFDKSSAVDIVSYYVENRALYDENLNPTQKKQLKHEAREEGEALFQRFLNEVPTYDDQLRLDLTWNRLYNAEAPIRYDKVPVGFECSDTFKQSQLAITPTQREGIAFGELTGSSICAFDVGVGKTMTAIVAAANGLYSGRWKRPLFIVPSGTKEKWVREMFGMKDKKGNYVTYGVLSGTKWKLNDWENLGKGTIADTLGKKNSPLTKLIPEGTITIVTYEGFAQMGFSKETEGEMMIELGNALLQSADDGGSVSKSDLEAGGKGKKKKSGRDDAKEDNRLAEMVGEALIGTICDYDTLGIDGVMIDEGHNFKNVFASVNSDDEGNKRHAVTGSVSKRGLKAFLLCNYLQRKYHGNVQILTATPFTNSPLEVYSMLSLVGYNSLKRQGIANIRTFFDTFVVPTVEWSVNVEGKLTEKEVVKGFINRVVLQKLIHNHIIYRTGEDANVPRPCKVNLPRINVRTSDGTMRRLPPDEQILTYLKASPVQAYIQQRIADDIANARADMKDRETFAEGRAAMLAALGKSLNNAFTPFLTDEGAAVLGLLTEGLAADDLDVVLEAIYSRPVRGTDEYDKLMKQLHNIPYGVTAANLGSYLKGTGGESLESLLKRSSDKSKARLVLEHSPKIEYAVQCVESVARWHRARSEACSGQVIYSNRGKEYFALIKEELETRCGFKKGGTWEKKDADGKIVGRIRLDEVEMMTGEVNETKRENIKDAFLAGYVKVILGTSTIREGVDLQKRGTVIYNLYPDWNPTDVRQLEGRIWRQGNDFGYVRVAMPLVQNTMDVFVFQKLEEKSGRINELWFKSDRGNVLDLESLDPQEIKLALLTDLEALATMFLDTERAMHERKIKAKQDARNVMANVRGNIDEMHYALRTAKSYLQTILNGGLYEAQRMQQLAESGLRNNPDQKTYWTTRLKAAEWFEALYEAGTKWNISPEQDAKELIALRRFFRTDAQRQYLQYFGQSYYYTLLNNNLGEYSEKYAKVVKAERGILRPMGHDLNSDLAAVVGQLDAELAALQGGKDYYKAGGPRFEELLQEVAMKKKELAVDGKSVGERVAEFGRLNYLMGFAYSRDTSSCTLPDNPGSVVQRQHAETQPATRSDNPALKLLKLRAKAAKAKLLLEAEAHPN